MEKNKKFKTVSQFASTFFSFSYFTNSHKLLLKKKKTKNKKLTKVNPGFLIIVYIWTAGLNTYKDSKRVLTLAMTLNFFYI